RPLLADRHEPAIALKVDGVEAIGAFAGNLEPVAIDPADPQNAVLPADDAGISGEEFPFPELGAILRIAKLRALVTPSNLGERDRRSRCHDHRGKYREEEKLQPPHLQALISVPDTSPETPPPSSARSCGCHCRRGRGRRP